MSGLGKGKKKRATDGRREEKEKKLGKFGGGEKLSSLFPRRKKRDRVRNGAGQVATPDQQPKELSLLWWT